MHVDAWDRDITNRKEATTALVDKQDHSALNAILKASIGALHGKPEKAFKPAPANSKVAKAVNAALTAHGKGSLKKVKKLLHKDDEKMLDKTKAAYKKELATAVMGLKSQHHQQKNVAKDSAHYYKHLAAKAKNEGKKFAQQGAEASKEATEEANEDTKKADKSIAHTMKKGLSKMERVVQEAHKVNQQENTDAKEAFGKLDHTSKKHQSLKKLLHNDFKSVVMAEAKKHAVQKPVQPDVLDQLREQSHAQGVIEESASVFDGLAFPMDNDDDEDEKQAPSASEDSEDEDSTAKAEEVPKPHFTMMERASASVWGNDAFGEDDDDEESDTTEATEESKKSVQSDDTESKKSDDTEDDEDDEDGLSHNSFADDLIGDAFQ